MLVFYAHHHERSLEFKLVKGKELQEIEINKLSKGLQYKYGYEGERVTLGIFNDMKDEGKNEDLLIVKTKDKSV